MDANNKLKELTEKIHREGVQKANMEAEEIIEKARNEAEEILSKAKSEAESIINSGKKQAEELSQKIEADVRLKSQQAIANLKREISDLVQAKVLKEPLSDAFKDNSFITNLLEIIVEKWDSNAIETNLQILLPKDKLEMAEKYFKQKSAQVLNDGLIFNEYNGPGSGFEIRPDKGHYKISMTDEAFNSFLKEYFNQQTLEFLYGGK